MIERFPIEAGAILAFARAIGDPNPSYDVLVTDPTEVLAPPTFVSSGSHFDPDFHLRPQLGGPPFDQADEADIQARLHAEQHFEYQRPLRAGEVLTAATHDGERWEKVGRRGGRLVFTERFTDYFDERGELVVRARLVSVRTSQAVGPDHA